MLTAPRLPALWLLLVLAGGCTNAAVDQAVGTSEGGGVALERSDAGIVVQNGVGRPLLNVRLAIEPDAGAPFVYVVPTLDAGARREVPFAEFRSEEGAVFDPGYFAPRQVTAAARDTLGGSHDARIPWAR
jgi:hypothetical protein